MTEHLLIDTSTLPDSFLEALAEHAALSAASSNADMATWGRELGAAVSSVRSSRVILWSDFADGTGFPDWPTCVATLPDADPSAEL
jgi:hypothetical protein